MCQKIQKKFKKISGGDGSAPPLNLLLQGELLALTVESALRQKLLSCRQRMASAAAFPFFASHPEHIQVHQMTDENARSTVHTSSVHCKDRRYLNVLGLGCVCARNVSYLDVRKLLVKLKVDGLLMRFPSVSTPTCTRGF